MPGFKELSEAYVMLKHQDKPKFKKLTIIIYELYTLYLIFYVEILAITLYNRN